MSLQIIKGIKTGATRAVIYGTEGIGKSTLAAQTPNSLIIDTEDGSGQIDAARVVALDWRAIEHAIKELIADSHGFSAVIIDTADWLEKALIEHMLKQTGKKSIEDYGYGKGYTILQEHVVRFLGLIDQLIAKGMHVVFVAHAKVTRTSPPDQTDGFDRYELKLTKQVAPLLKEWADLVLFCNYKIQIVEGTDGRLKAQGGKERVMYATHSAAWDAKNRYSLPDEMPMEFAQIAHVFAVAEPRKQTSKQAAEAAADAATTTDPTPRQDGVSFATKDQVAKLRQFAATPKGAQLIEAALEPINALTVDELTTEEAAKLIASLETADDAPVLPPHISTWLNANEDAVNDYFRSVHWLTGNQTWRDLEDDRLHSVVDKFHKVQNAVTTHAKTARKAA